MYSFVSSLSPCKSPVNLRISPEAEVDLIVPTTQRAERVGCAVAHPCAVQRRLTLMGVNIFSYVHTSFPLDPEGMQAGSTRNFTSNFVYNTKAPFGIASCITSRRRSRPLAKIILLGPGPGRLDEEVSVPPPRVFWRPEAA